MMLTINQPTLMNLTLSRCRESEFTCDDGSCIPSEQRCDLVQNCEDFTDELGCDTVSWVVDLGSL